jgi:AcrR family transcriptional regulator
MPGTTNRHVQQRNATREALREAAVARFVADGFDNVTVTEIAADVGVTERTFYRHFSSKEAVLFQDYDERLEWLSAALALRPTTESIFDSALAALRTFPYDIEIVRQAAMQRSNLISQERVNEHMRIVQANFAAELARHFERRYADHPDVDLLAAVAGSALAGAAVAAVEAWGRRGCRQDLEAMVHHAIGFVESGLNPEGMSVLT